MINPIGNLLKKFSLLTQFSLLALIIITIVGIAGVFGMQSLLEQNMVLQETNNAVDQVDSVLEKNLTPSDFTAPPDPARLKQIDSLVRSEIINDHVMRIDIHNRSGQVIYSDDVGTVGQSHMDEKLAQALDGKVVSEITEPTSEHFSDPSQYGQLIEIDAPIRVQGLDEVQGIYEIFHDMGVLDSQIATMRRTVGLITGLGLAVLYTALFGIVLNASRKLTRTSKENLRLFEEERMRRSELTALYDISRALAKVHPTKDETLNIIVRRAVETIHSTFASVLIIENGNIIGSVSFPVRVLGRRLESQCVLAANLPFLQKVLAQDEPVFLESGKAADISESERMVLGLDLAKTLSLIPIKIEGRTTGALLIGEARSDNREPFTPQKLSLAKGIADQTATAMQRAQLFSDLEQTYLETVLSLANAIEAKDTYTKNHTDNVSRMAVLVGKELGLTKKELEDLRFGSILHDIGKIAVPDATLNKPGKLNDEEWVQMRAHAAKGADILKPIPRLSSAADIVRHHHERYDGNGYPDGLVGQDIPIGARILTTIDSYSAMVDRRPYKAARSHEDTVSELKRCSGSQFDPRAVDAFLGLFERGALIPGEYDARVVEEEPLH
ncbi:MAG: HD-GYP domain-containing protein [Thermoleophilia bacterium]